MSRAVEPKNGRGQTMGGKQSSKAGNNSIEFVSYSPTAEDRKVITRTLEAGFNPCHFMQELSEGGYKLTIKFNERQDALQASVTGDGPENPNTNVILLCYHKDAEKLLGTVFHAIKTKFRLDVNWIASVKPDDVDW